MVCIGSLVILFFAILIVAGAFFATYNKKTPKKTKENFVVQPCYTCEYGWDKCYDSCLSIYDQAKSEICKEQCNDMFLLKNAPNTEIFYP